LTALPLVAHRARELVVSSILEKSDLRGEFEPMEAQLGDAAAASVVFQVALLILKLSTGLMLRPAGLLPETL
jgi:hypothetical protein